MKRQIPTAHPEAPVRQGPVECVYLTCFRREFSSLATILQYSGLRLERAESVDEADFLLTVTGATVLISDVTFPDGTWRDALHMAAGTHPLVAPAIAADPVDWPFLADAYDRGACDVLWKPIHFLQAIQTIESLDEAARERSLWAAEGPPAGARRAYSISKATY
jgi:DNA-binding NtrC family response regulator